jgi:serine/threonine protein kinase
MQLFDELLPLGPAERLAALARACGDDEPARGLFTGGLPAAAFAPEPEVLPAQVGPYRLVRLLGRGGMGSVHLAERDDAFRKQVAVKLLRQDLDTPELVARFQAERQILASLEHAGIARLLDGGAASGRPYLVMEYVEGQPIDQYCAAHGLDVRARLELMRQVCATSPTRTWSCTGT